MDIASSPVQSDAHSAGARSVIYKILAEGFDYPSEETFNITQNGKVEALLRQAARDAGIADQQPIESALQVIEQGEAELSRGLHLVDLEVEYNRLFAPTDQSLLCPPYESAVLGLNITQKVNGLADVMGFYRAWGLDVSEQRHEFPDSIVAELEFLHFLTYKERNAIQMNEEEHIELTRQSLQHFLEDHFLTWVPQFCASVLENSCYDWYRGLAGFTRAFAASEAAKLQACR